MKRAPLLVRAFYGLAAPILLLAGGGLVDTAQSQTSTTPPFYPGQVVVSGNPDDLPKEYIIIYHPQRGWYEEAPPRGALSFGRSPEEPLLPEEGPARARLS
jgi:hypothetical protein